MIRLILAELRIEWRLWVAAAVALVAAGTVGGIDAALIATAGTLTGDASETLWSIASAIMMFNGVTAAVVISGTTTLCVGLQRRRHALWQIVGCRPGQIGLIVLGQVVVLALVAGALGAALAAPLAAPFFNLISSTTPQLARADVVYPVPAAAWSVVLVVTVSVLGAFRGALRASRVRPVEALREQEDPIRGVGAGRWVLAIVAIALTAPSLIIVVVLPLGSSVGGLLFVGPLTVAAVSALSPLLLPLLMRAWTSTLPRGLSSAWHLARADALHKISLTTSVVNPVFTAAALVGGLFVASATVSHAYGAATGRAPSGSGGDPRQLFALLGGPVLLAGIGAAATIVMSGRNRNRDLALLRVAGGTRGLAVGAAALEAVIYSITATLAAAGVVAGEGALIAALLAVRTPGTTPGFDLGAMFMICGAGLLLLLIATVAPTAASLRRSPAREVSAS